MNAVNVALNMKEAKFQKNILRITKIKKKNALKKMQQVIFFTFFLDILSPFIYSSFINFLFIYRNNVTAVKRRKKNGWNT